MRAPALLFGALLAACNNTSTPAAPDAAMAEVSATDSAPADSAPTDNAPSDVVSADAAADAVPSRDVPVGTECSFNRDCAADQRCGCTETAGCHCEVGPRGTGRAGVDACASGNDCASALCVEGNAGMLCSDACTAASECPSALPRCLSVPLVGRFCARDPAGGSDGGVAMLTAQFGTRTGAFDRGVHGISGTDGVYLEAHFGGMAGCPTMTSPTPRRTLVLRGLRAVTTEQTQATGVSATLFDFGGDLTSEPLVRSTAVRVTFGTTDRERPLTAEINVTFPGGTIRGTVTTQRCTSLDG